MEAFSPVGPKTKESKRMGGSGFSSNRRLFLSSSIALLGSWPLAVPALARKGGGTLDLSNDRDFLQAITKMRGSTTDELVMGFVIGRYYGIVDDRATPLFGVLAGTFSQYRQIDEDAYRGRALEVAYFTDINSGELIETFEVPYTGETVEVPQTRMGPSTFKITARGLEVEQAAGEARGMELHHRFRPAVAVNDQVWITEEIQASVAPPGRKAFVYNEMSSYQANRRDLEDPDQSSVRCSVQFHSIISWRPWLKMGDHPGHLTGRGGGRHVKAFSELPVRYQQLTKIHHPDVAADPLALLQA